jgi:hypothetical protein
MKLQSIVATCFVFSGLALAAANAQAADVSPLPIQTPGHRIILRNHFVPLDTSHDVVITAGSWTPASTTPQAVCYTVADIFLSGAIQCNTATGAPFAADFGGGADIAAVDWVTTQAVSGGGSPQIYDIVYGPETTGAGTELLHLAGLLDIPASSSTVTASVTLREGMSADPSVYGDNQKVGAGNVPPAGFLVLALQTLDDANNWDDVATSVWDQSPDSFSVSANIASGNAVRAVLREASAWKGYFAVESAILMVPECVPDVSNPGSCL